MCVRHVNKPFPKYPLLDLKVSFSTVRVADRDCSSSRVKFLKEHLGIEALESRAL